MKLLGCFKIKLASQRLSTCLHARRGDATPTSAAAITFHKNDFMHISAMKNFSSIILYDLRLSHSHRTTDGRESGTEERVHNLARILHEEDCKNCDAAAKHAYASPSHLELQILTRRSVRFQVL